jgi:hypothetical protein
MNFFGRETSDFLQPSARWTRTHSLRGRLTMTKQNEIAKESYAHFVRRHFRDVYQFCAENGTDHARAEIAAQRIIFDLYHLEESSAHAA